MNSFILLIALLLFCIGCSCGKKHYNTVGRNMRRSTTFSPKIADKTCLLKPQKGPCRAAINMYYFDPSDMNCTKTFKWGGCMGNGNRFDTYGECIDTCLTQVGRKTKPQYCSLRFDYGFCFGDVKRWYYDQMWHVCKETIYSGCGGNKNNFYTQAQCEAICRFGNGPATVSLSSDRIKKVIIINPLDSTPHRGKDQTAATTVISGDAAAGKGKPVVPAIPG